MSFFFNFLQLRNIEVQPTIDENWLTIGANVRPPTWYQSVLNAFGGAVRKQKRCRKRDLPIVLVTAASNNEDPMEMLRQQIVLLHDENAKLKEENCQLNAKNTELNGKNTELNAENDTLKEEIRKLKEGGDDEEVDDLDDGGIFKDSDDGFGTTSNEDGDDEGDEGGDEGEDDGDEGGKGEGEGEGEELGEGEGQVGGEERGEGEGEERGDAGGQVGGEGREEGRGDVDLLPVHSSGNLFLLVRLYLNILA